MQIINAIAHKIIKDQQEKGKPPEKAVVKPRESVFDPTDEKVTLLTEALLHIYKTGKTFGSFNDDASNHPFQTWVKGLYSPDYSTEAFISLTLDTVNRIALYIEKQNFATGGYLVFVHYHHNDQACFLIAMIKNKGGLTFTPDMELMDVQSIDLDKLHQAARIDINRFKDGEEGYLSFLKGDQKKDITGYFTEALGCTDLIPSNVATDTVFHVIDEICSEANLSETKWIRDGIYDFLKERHPNTVRLEEIAAKLNAHLPIDYHGHFIEKANSDESRISQEFVPSLTALRKYKKAYVKGNTWNLSFDKGVLGTPDSDAEIVFNEEERSLTINSLSKKLMDELNKVIHERNKITTDTNE